MSQWVLQELVVALMGAQFFQTRFIRTHRAVDAITICARYRSEQSEGGRCTLCFSVAFI